MSNQKDISLENISVSVPGKTLIENTDFKVSYGKKYALMGANGLGKSTLLKQIADKTIPIENNIDIFYVDQELDFDPNKTVFQIVLDANRKRKKLMNKLDKLNKLMEDETNENADQTAEDYNKTLNELQSMDFMKDESIIRKILCGLGFNQKEQEMKFSQFSGGYKMRVSLATGLYMRPTLLLLDEPTNHLDLNAVIWLTDYLINVWKKSLIVVSHDAYFLNEICTDIIHLENKKLTYYKGNYHTFKKTYDQQIKTLENEWNKIQKRAKEMQKKSVPKSEVQKFMETNAHLEPPKVYKVNIMFPEATEIKWPSLTLSDVTFGYGDKILFNNIDLSLFENEKITIVGANGSGKSSLMQVMTGQLKPISGQITKDPRLRIGFYNQHVSDILPQDKTPIEFLQSVNKNMAELDIRKVLGTIGLAGPIHLQQLSTLSGGQKARVVLGSLCIMNPHILLLDEPTNHLDIESIESLIKAINKFNGAVIMITHNIDVIQKTNSQIYKLENNKLTNIDFDDYYVDVLEEINNIE